MAARVSERVRVHLRVRPRNSSELVLPGKVETFEFLKENKVSVSSTSSDDKQVYQFDRVFQGNAKQAEIYDSAASSIASDVMEGYNGTIIAYGQTGTGKTHTMYGADMHNVDRGIIPRALDDIFATVEKERDRYAYTIAISYVQLYCEMILDLLRPESANLSIREDAERGTFIEGCSSFKCKSKEDALYYIALGDENRVVASTAMNAVSSRSHACVTLLVERRLVSDGTELADDKPSQKVVYGRLVLVDLAGSERVGKSNVFGKHFEELKSINLSLSALGNCISSLAKKGPRTHIPYRDSKLTRLLSDCLGGNSKTSLVITVAPTTDDLSETMGSLAFGKRAMKVLTQSKLNVEIDYKALCAQLQARLDAKDDTMNPLHLEIARLKDENAFLKNEVSSSRLMQKNAEAELASATSTYQASVDAMKRLASEKGFDPKERVSIVEEVNAKWQAEMDVFQRESTRQLERLREECESKMTKMRQTVTLASQEWNTIEVDLQSSKEEHLDTLRALRIAREDLVLMEKQMAARVGELMDALAERDAEPVSSKVASGRRGDAMESKSSLGSDDLTAALDAANAEIESNKAQFQKEMEQLQGIYARKFDVLARRVQQLEDDRVTPRLPPVAGGSSSLFDMDYEDDATSLSVGLKASVTTALGGRAGSREKSTVRVARDILKNPTAAPPRALPSKSGGGTSRPSAKSSKMSATKSILSGAGY